MYRSRPANSWAAFALLLTVIISNNSFSYTLPVGSADLERLTCLNEVINPHSIAFLEQHIKPGDHVLELGAGYGMMSQELAKIVGKKGSVLATDISKDQLKIARSLAKKITLPWLKFQKASATNLKKTRKKYDAVYMRLLLMHMPNPLHVVEQVKRVLKPGGIMIIEDSAAAANEIRSTPHDARIELLKKMAQIQQKTLNTHFGITKKLKEQLPQNGFTVVSYNEIEPPLDTPSKRKNFSLAIDAFKPAVLKMGVITEQDVETMKKIILSLEADTKITLYFPPFGQIAARMQ